MPEDYFPGSRQPITPVAGPPDTLSGREGKTFTIQGKEVELFTISQLAYFLKRKPVTIRKWERDGVIPKATFSKPGAGGDVRGRRRLYSREQVVALVHLAHDEGILHDLHKQIGTTNFKAKAWAKFKEIAAR